MIQSELAPYNVRYYFAVGLLLSPAVFAYAWRERRQERRKISTSKLPLAFRRRQTIASEAKAAGSRLDQAYA